MENKSPQKEKRQSRNSRLLSTIVTFLLCVFCNTFLFAQNDVVKGTLKDVNGVTLPGVSVIVKGTTTGTVSDILGNYAIKVSGSNPILVFSYIGYKRKEVIVNNRKIINEVMEEDANFLEEVIVVGYGTQKKVNLTGAVESINNEELLARPVGSVSQLMQGLAVGTNITPSGQNGYEPGATMNVQLRGQGNAYVLIDGVPGSLDQVNPNDIASISILKDAASAAIYGARAAYGVILVTTKSGKAGKPIISFSNNVAATQLARMPKMVDSYTYAKAMNEAAVNSGVALPFANDAIDRILAFQKDPSLPETTADLNGNWRSNVASNANRDWFKEFYGTSINHQENLSIRGGSDAVSYYLSAGYNKNEGVLKYGTDYADRINGTAKFDIQLEKWLKVSSNTQILASVRERPSMDKQGNYELMFHQIARIMPTQAMKTPNGYYAQNSRIITILGAGNERTEGNQLTQSISTVISPLKGWTINADYSFQLYNEKYVSNNFTTYSDKVDGTLIPDPQTVPSYVEKHQRQTFYNTLNIYTSYDKKIKNSHTFQIVLGYQQESFIADNLMGTKLNLISRYTPALATATGDDVVTDALDNNLKQWATMGMFGRFGYNYKEKYLMEINSRYDGTSRFAPGHRWQIFPSVSFGWNIAKEKFFKNFTDRNSKLDISMLKLRASWGSLGNQLVTPYQDLPLLSASSGTNWLLSGVNPVYVTAPNLINPNLTWESSQTTNFGFDLSMLNYRLTFTGDLYIRETKQRLGPAEAVPAVIGVPTSGIPKANNSTLRTDGWETKLSWTDGIGKDFTYSVSAILFDNQSTVMKYNNPTKILTTDYIGKKAGEIWGFVTDRLINTQEEADLVNTSRSQAAIYSGIWKTGDILYKDLDGDQIITRGDGTFNNPGDQKVIGNTTPRYQYALTLGASYKGVDLAALLQGVGKRDIWFTDPFSGGNTPIMFWNFAGAAAQSVLYEGVNMDYYRDYAGDDYNGLGLNTDSYFPRPYITNAMNPKNRQPQTRYLQSAAYLRIKNVQIGYTFPIAFTEKIGLSKLRIYVSGDNVYVFTNKHFPKGLDPETVYYGGKGNAKSMPAQRFYSGGLQIQF